MPIHKKKNVTPVKRTTRKKAPAKKPAKRPRKR
jgi:hypothetical protein